MSRRRSALAAFIASSLGGCVLVVDEPKLRVESNVEGWEIDSTPQGTVAASLRGHLADVVVSVRGADPFTPVSVRVRPMRDATVRVLHDGADRREAGAWRLGDLNGRYSGTRVPRTFSFGDDLAAPRGAELLLEFDPDTVLRGASPSSGDEVCFDLRIATDADVETVPVSLRVADVHRGWRLRLPSH